MFTFGDANMIKHLTQFIDEHFESYILNPIEYWLWKFRYVTFLAVIFCAIASVALFYHGVHGDNGPDSADFSLIRRIIRFRSSRIW